MTAIQEVGTTMSAVIQIDRFTRNNLSVSGSFCPQNLSRLAAYLADAGGEITYLLSGSRTKDPTGSQKRRVKCIISGWILLADPVTSKPIRHEISITSCLVIVATETELPPLEMESDDEDYVVCDGEMDVMERVEEEILLDLPAAFGGQISPLAKSPTSPGTKASPPYAGAITGRLSPFAKLAELKKK